MTATVGDGKMGGLRERKKQQRREALHEATVALIERNGLEGTTVEEICDEVGVSPRTFFNYFPSKTAAALNLPEQIISDVAAARFRAAHGELMPAVCEVIEVVMGAGLERKRLKQLVADQPELMAALVQWTGNIREEFVQLVAERAGSREVAADAIALAMTALKVLMHREGADSDSRPGATRLLETIDRLIAVRQAPMVEPRA